MIISSSTFADGAREAAVWLDEHEDVNIAVISVSLRMSEDEKQPVEGTIRYTEA